MKELREAYFSMQMTLFPMLEEEKMNFLTKYKDLQMTSQRVTYLHDLMDAVYDAGIRVLGIFAANECLCEVSLF